MAPRLNTKQSEQTREAIKTTQLVKRLQSFAFNEPDVEIDMPRLKAIEILLRKSLPDLSTTTIEGGETPLLTSIAIRYIDASK